MDIFDQLHEEYRGRQDDIYDNTVYNYDYVGNYLKTVEITPYQHSSNYQHFIIQNETNVVFKNFRLKKQNNNVEYTTLEIGGQKIERIYNILKPIFNEFVNSPDIQYNLNTNVDKVQLFYKKIPFELNSKLLNYINFSRVNVSKIENNQFKNLFVYGKQEIRFMCGMGGLVFAQ